MKTLPDSFVAEVQALVAKGWARDDIALAVLGAPRVSRGARYPSDKIGEVRALLAKGAMTPNQIAVATGVSSSTVRSIKAGRTHRNGR